MQMEWTALKNNANCFFAALAQNMATRGRSVSHNVRRAEAPPTASKIALAAPQASRFQLKTINQHSKALQIQQNARFTFVMKKQHKSHLQIPLLLLQ